jgi:hypothetical protein
VVVRAFGDQVCRGHGLFDRDDFVAARGEQQGNQQDQRSALHGGITGVRWFAGSAMRVA